MNIFPRNSWCKAKPSLFFTLLLLSVALGCGGTAASPPGAGAPVTGSTEGIEAVKHIIFTLQENRSFDTYFGKLGEYRAKNGYGSASDIDGIPANASNPTGAGTLITAYKLQTSCMENLDPNWLESHGDYNFDQPGSDVFLGNGYVHNAQGQAKFSGLVSEVGSSSGTIEVTPEKTTNYYLFASDDASIDVYSSLPVAVATVVVSGDPIAPAAGPVTGGGTITASAVAIAPGNSVTLTWSAPSAAKTMVNTWYDQMGRRVMGYYDGDALPYYYFLASNFATSDRWFSPVPSNSPPNRVFSLAATTAGHVHDPGILDSSKVKNIFQLLEEKNISWKVYYTIDPNRPNEPHTMLTRFQPWASQHMNKVVHTDEYFNDLKNGTLPQVAFIEELPGYDEHPGATLASTVHSGNNVQAGAEYMSKFINALMQSQYWKDSVFILTFDEAGGEYDHVPGQPAVHPDGIKPLDLEPKDNLYIVPQGDFDRTGFRAPLLVISPFTKKSYVSHTVADNTAILKFIQTRFGLPNLTNRDKAQIDMTEFFSFKNPPWLTPPTPPAQPVTMPCDYSNLK